MRSTLLCLLVVLLCTPMSFAATVSYIPITNDADSGIDFTKVYTHTVDLGTGGLGAVVNLVPFTRVDGGNIDSIPGFSYTVNTGLRSEHPGNGSHNVSGDLVNLLTDMFYNGNNEAGGVATLTLSGLTVGTTYDTRVYSRQWGVNPNRIAQIDFENDGVAGADDTVTINQDDASASPPGLDADNRAYALSYQFTAQTSELTVSFTQSVLNNSWHQYGVSNEVVGANSGRVVIDTLFNTGVDDNGLVLASGVADPHYELVGTGAATVAVGHSAYLANDAAGTEGSSWIGPIADLAANVPPGDYNYSTEFDLSGLNPDSAEVYIKVAVDDSVGDVLLNGVSTGVSAGGFGVLNGWFTLDSGFWPGVNTLEFVTVNAPGDPVPENPHGFRAEVAGTALVPEPSTLVLAAMGLLGLVFWGRRKRAV